MTRSFSTTPPEAATEENAVQALKPALGNRRYPHLQVATEENAVQALKRGEALRPIDRAGHRCSQVATEENAVQALKLVLLLSQNLI